MNPKSRAVGVGALALCGVLSTAALAAPQMHKAAAAPIPTVSTAQREELAAIYHHVEDEYYKKTDPRILLAGSYKVLIAYLKAGGVAHPVVPAPVAGADDDANIHALVHELENATATYGRHFGAQKLMYAEIIGVASSVKDRYTVFLAPREYSALNEDLDGGNFSGVGLSINVDPKTKFLHVDEVITGGPAEKAGLEAGDLIIAIDGRTTKNATTEADSHRLRGKSGTLVRLTVLRDGKPLAAPFAVTRAVIHQPSVIAKMLPGNIGYAHLTVFGATTGRELSEALSKLQAQGAKAYVLDLRDNGGGYLTAAVDVASNFVPSGPIVSVEARGGDNTQFDAEDTAITPRPLAVLVNRFTASASEITSGAIQDNGVGTLIGTRTFGKGVVQTIFPLTDGSAIKVTTARYFTPHGRDINTVGIQPDISSELTKSAKIGDPAHDNQLQTAITFLNGKIAAELKNQTE